MSRRSSVRQRVLQNTRKLLTNGAVAGGAFVTACYAVVDPLPPPCPSFNMQYLPTGHAQLDGNTLSITFSTINSWNGGWFVDERVDRITGVDGGQLRSGNYEKLTFDVAPGAATLSFEVPLLCNGSSTGPVMLRVSVDLTTGPDGGPDRYPRVSVTALDAKADGGM